MFTTVNGLTPLITVTNNAIIRAPPNVEYLIVIVMENANYGEIIGCNIPSCSYTSPLALNNSRAANYYSQWCTSLPNYLVLAGASDAGYGCNSCDPGHCGNLWPIKTANIIDRTESSGRTWKAYMADYPIGPTTPQSIGGCFIGNYQKYVAIHNPFVYYDNVLNNTSRCNRIVRANTANLTTGPETMDLFLNDLQSPATASNLMWLTPNNCDNAHDLCYGTTRYMQGNQYLSQLVPSILNSPLFQSQKAALFLTWDEASGGTGQIAAIWAGPTVRTHYCSCTNPPIYTHASFPKTLETIWTLPSLGQLDDTSLPMTEFFL